MNKILLYFKIRKFYNIFGEVVGENFITKLSDVTADNVRDVLFDINEVTDDYDDAWLNKLRAQIINFCERPRHHLIVVVLIVLAIIGGYTIGRHNTIRQAELLDITENEYHIGFGDEVHIYTFEGGTK